MPHPTQGGPTASWWPAPAQPEDPRQERAGLRPHGGGVRLRRRVREPRPGCRPARHRAGADHLAGLVARRLRPLRPAHGPDGVARRGHVPHPGRPRRRRHRHAALRAAEQLARQPRPGQGAQAAVAGQEEVRPQALLGRSDDLRGQRRPGVDGLQDPRLRGRPGRRLGARDGRLLGSRARLARRRAAHPRPRTRESAGRLPDGSDLRQPGGPARRAGPVMAGRDIRETHRRMGSTTRRPSR